MMNKEQAIQTLQENAQLLHFEHPHLGLEEAIGVVIEALSKPSLPSNLDEAAEEYANRGISSNADPYEETMAYRADKDAFKAGVAWMAGQSRNEMALDKLKHE